MIRNRPRRPKRDLSKELIRRERGQRLSRISFFRSMAGARLLVLVPARFHWLVPMLQDAGLDALQREEELEEEAEAAPTAPALRPEVRDALAIPALAEKSEIVGLRGRYRLDFLHRVRGKGRLYQGTDTASEQL